MKNRLLDLFADCQIFWSIVNPFNYTLVRRNRLGKLLQDEAIVYYDYEGEWPIYDHNWEWVTYDNGGKRRANTGKLFQPWRAKPIHKWEYHGH